MLGALGPIVALLVVISAAAFARDLEAESPVQNTMAVTTAMAITPAPTTDASGNGDMPNLTLTPGAAVTTDTAVICRPGYATSIRPTGALWRHLRDEAYDRYGLSRGRRGIVGASRFRHPAYEVDHLVPLELGGDPTNIRNIWPQPIAAAKRKDDVENELHDSSAAGE